LQDSAFGIVESQFCTKVFGAQRTPFTVHHWRGAGAIRVSVTLMGQDIGNTVTVLVHDLNGER